jgi:hypothetical protein
VVGWNLVFKYGDFSFIFLEIWQIWVMGLFLPVIGHQMAGI